MLALLEFSVLLGGSLSRLISPELAMSLALAVAVLAAFAWSSRRFVASLLTRKHASDWRLEMAVVEKQSIDTEPGKSIERFVANVSYSYKVDGDYYAGHFSRGCEYEGEAQLFLDQFPMGSLIEIRVNPCKPEESVSASTLV